jgi:hypothetical protein
MQFGQAMPEIATPAELPPLIMFAFPSAPAWSELD